MYLRIEQKTFFLAIRVHIVVCAEYIWSISSTILIKAYAPKLEKI